ncbi:MAG: HlyD family efflux transporter periplasmic adaptor subunit [Candidatus Margulisbacteria bacterium]|nr:HlyD family efflux transporter periplasmic adaptor subunit [Candidatus Margulisiibacteriota bacterium]
MKKIIVTLSILIILIVTGYKVISHNKQTSLNIISVKKGSIVQAVYGLGTVTARRSYTLKAGVVDSVTKLYVTEGQAVKKGQALLKTETEFQAPFSGTITSLPYKLGEVIFPQNPILTLTDLSDMYIVVSLEQEAALLVRKGQKVIVSFETIRNVRFTGHVSTLLSNENQFLVRVEGLKFPPNILPGMTGDVAIEISKKNQALLIPIRAITNGHQVTLKNHQTQQITLGIVDGEIAEILSGLHEGDSLILPEK